MKLAHDSIEAIRRINVGLKSVVEYKSLGAHSTSHVELMEGPLVGARGFHSANPDAVELWITPFPQVSFSNDANGPFHRFRIDELPTKDELIPIGFERGCMLHIGTHEVGFEKVRELLTAKNTRAAGADASPTYVKDERSKYAETVTRFSHPEFRCAAKIALNYLAAVVGADVARMSAFDQAREHVRHGESQAKVNVHPFENRWFLGRTGHYVSLTRSQDLIVVQVSLLLDIQYFVVLAKDATVPLISMVYFFDLATRKLVEIEPLPIKPGRPLKALAHSAGRTQRIGRRSRCGARYGGRGR